jgi:hypothetical protein
VVRLICAGPGPGTLASGKLLSTQYQPPSPNRAVDGGKVYSAALRKMASDPQLQRTVAVKGREIELAVQNLEEEMVASQQQLSQLEDSLANRYLDLEGSAAHISVSEYEALFEQLEAERRELSDEKLKLQVSAARDQVGCFFCVVSAVLPSTTMRMYCALTFSCAIADALRAQAGVDQGHLLRSRAARAGYADRAVHHAARHAQGRHHHRGGVWARVDAGQWQCQSHQGEDQQGPRR